MVEFSTIIKKFDEKGEKSGWTYIVITHDAAKKIKPGFKKTFRVRGSLDNYLFEGIALLPMGGGDFMMALNSTIRKGIGKNKGAKIRVRLEADNKFAIEPTPEFLDCLADEPSAIVFFKTLAKSHQSYFIKWIDNAKTEPTRTRRIAQAVSALSKGHGFGEMIRALKKSRKDLLG